MEAARCLMNEGIKETARSTTIAKSLKSSRNNDKGNLISPLTPLIRRFSCLKVASTLNVQPLTWRSVTDTNKACTVIAWREAVELPTRDTLDLKWKPGTFLLSVSERWTETIREIMWVILRAVQRAQRLFREYFHNFCSLPNTRLCFSLLFWPFFGVSSHWGFFNNHRRGMRAWSRCCLLVGGQFFRKK